MTTTLTQNILFRAIRIFICFAICLNASIANAQSKAQVNLLNTSSQADFGTYEFVIGQVQNRADAKEFNEQTRGLFDCVPNFEERTRQFSFNARFSFEQKDIIEKLTALGYEVIYFKQRMVDE